MNQLLSDEQLRDIYRDDYVERYERKSLARLARLMPLMSLAADDVVADFGCGNGMLLDLIHDRVRAYSGVDFSAEFIATARRRAERLGAVNAHFHATAIEDFCRRHPDTFDVAFALDFAEHAYDPSWLAILAAIHASLKPGGRLYLHTPNARFIIEVLKARGVLHQHPGHVAVRDAAANRALLEQAAFRDVRVRYLAHYVPWLKWLHLFGSLPLVGPYCRARLFIECRRQP